MTSRISFRKAGTNDTGMLLAWRNDPSTRKNSINTSTVGTKEHAQWLRRTLASRDRLLLVGEKNGPLGQVRFDRIKGEDYGISITIAPERRKKGLGKRMLWAALDHCRSIGMKAIFAKIKPTNTASVKVFERCGFRLVRNDRILEYKYQLDEKKVGLKIWSKNTESFPKLSEFYRKGTLDFVELYVVPGTGLEKLAPLKDLPIILHAPNFHHNFRINRTDKYFREGIGTVRLLSDYFAVDHVIFHPGYVESDDETEESIRNLRKLDFDIIVENMPRVGIEGFRLMGSRPENINTILKRTKARFCLDFGHAVASACFYRKDAMEILSEFAGLNPYIYHISDGWLQTAKDWHLHLGKGDFPLAEMVNLIGNSFVTLETPKGDYKGLSDDLANIHALRTLIGKSQRGL